MSSMTLLQGHLPDSDFYLQHKMYLFFVDMQLKKQQFILSSETRF